MHHLPVSEFSDHIDAIDRVTLSAYPEFLLHDPVAAENRHLLYEYLPQYQIVLRESARIAAVGNCIPIRLEDGQSILSLGWDDTLLLGIRQFRTGVRPNTLIALSVSLDEAVRGRGFGKRCLMEIRNSAASAGLSKLFIPVRPTGKHKYPLTDFDNYLSFYRDGKHVDPWLNAHLSLGATILGTAPLSMMISASVSEWEEWTGLKFPVSGPYHIPGGLVPLIIDTKHSTGLYVEPNVWMEHPLHEPPI